MQDKGGEPHGFEYRHLDVEKLGARISPVPAMILEVGCTV